MALGHATMILSWEENLSDEEMPEKWKWHLPWEIKAHMEQVVRDRKAKYEQGPKSDSDPAVPGGEAWEADEDDVQAFIDLHTGGGS